jgi:hypothetical protein
VQPISLSRYQVTARIEADFPRWCVWYDAPNGRYHARRRGRFRALSEPGAPLYSVAAGSASGLRVLLAAEDAKPPPDGWDC